MITEYKMNSAVQINQTEKTILVCRGTGCVSGGSDAILEALQREIKAAGLTNIKVDFTGCHGFCQRGPIVDIEPEGYFYTEVSRKMLQRLSNHTL